MTRRLIKLVKIISAVLVVLVVLAAISATWFVRRPWPQVDGTISVAGLSAPVRVLRDSWDIPQIYAQNEHDLFFSQGYVHAQERLWQMEFNRRVGSGTLSGAVGADALALDRFLRTFGLRRAAEKDWNAIDADTQGILQAYAAGVNAYIETHRDRLPVEFTIFGVQPQPWTPVDSLVWGKVMSLNLGFNYVWEILRARLVAKVGQSGAYDLMTPFDPEASGSPPPPAPLPPDVDNYSWLAGTGWPTGAEAFLGFPSANVGSNSWVVHGSRTATGKPILANDTHLLLSFPSVWFANGLHGGRFDTTGYSFPGVPLVIIGHNARIAWGVTNLPSDVQDLYIEQLDDPNNPTQYLYEGKWQPLQILNETIDVKGEAAVPLKVYLTRHGPIINSVRDALKNAKPIALRWTTLEGSQLFQAISMINHAGNWTEFRTAARNWNSPNLNIVYADVDGNIGYQMTGRIPIRAAGHTGELPIPGWSGAYEWKGYVPFDDLPSSFNPPSGFVVTANSKPTNGAYPYHIASEWASPYRIDRITELLAANQHVSIDDTKMIQAQTYSIPAKALRPYLLEVKPESDLQAQALEALRTWDLYLESDRVGAGIYEVWFWFLIQDMLKDELGDNLLAQYNLLSLTFTPNMIDWMKHDDTRWFDDVTTPQKETRSDIVRRSFNDAIAWLQEHYGSDPTKWQWGRLHPVTFTHQPLGESGIGILEYLFNSQTMPARGDDHTVNAAWFHPVYLFEMSGGTAQRLIVDFSNLDNTQGINSTGQSGLLFHPHRLDTMAMWENGGYYTMPSSAQAIQAVTTNSLLLTPQQ
jgi:penicillin G amidase